MSQVAQEGVEPITMDPYEIGWYIESADEEMYGPVSRQTLRRFLEDKTITPNTLVRHCTQPEARPAADQPGIMEDAQSGRERDRHGRQAGRGMASQEAGPASPGRRLAAVRLA